MKIDGLPVVDARHPVVLTITAADIRKGKPNDPSCCAAAVACMRQLHCKEARVHLARMYVGTATKWFRYLTPDSIRSEIIAYDRRSSFKPGDYLLRPDKPSKRATRGAGHGSKRDNGSHKPAKTARMKPHFVKGVRAWMKVA